MSRRELELPDSRPRLTAEASGIQGWQCVNCGHRVALPAPWCPRCRSELKSCDLGSTGVVWSSTVLRVPLPGREPPMSLAYVDLDSGPRVLAHLEGSGQSPIPVGAPVSIVGLSAAGDILVAPRATGKERTEVE